MTSLEDLPAIVYFAEIQQHEQHKNNHNFTEARIKAKATREQIEKAALQKYRNSKEFETYFDAKIFRSSPGNLGNTQNQQTGTSKHRPNEIIAGKHVY
jgi:hypothetical protein